MLSRIAMFRCYGKCIVVKKDCEVEQNNIRLTITKTWPQKRACHESTFYEKISAAHLWITDMRGSECVLSCFY